jgi:hypothetical protein
MCLVSLPVGRAQWNAFFQKSLLQAFGLLAPALR